MEALHWVALMLAVVGVTMVGFGIQQQRAARPSDELIGGFGGPAGSSDVGTGAGFGASGATDHYPVGRTLRLAGLGLVLGAVVLAILAELT